MLPLTLAYSITFLLNAAINWWRDPVLILASRKKVHARLPTKRKAWRRQEMAASRRFQLIAGTMVPLQFDWVLRAAPVAR